MCDLNIMATEPYVFTCVCFLKHHLAFNSLPVLIETFCHGQELKTFEMSVHESSIYQTFEKRFLEENPQKIANFSECR